MRCMFTHDSGVRKSNMSLAQSTVLSKPNPEYDSLYANKPEMSEGLQMLISNNNTIVGGVSWVYAMPVAITIGDKELDRGQAFTKQGYYSSFSYNMPYDTVLKTKNIHAPANNRYWGQWWQLPNEPYLLEGEFGIYYKEKRGIIDWEYYVELDRAYTRTPIFNMEYLKYGLPVFLIKGVHMTNSEVAPKPIVDGVLVCKSSQALNIKQSLYNIEQKIDENRKYATYTNNYFATRVPHYNMLPDHAFGVDDLVVFPDMCLKLDLVLQALKDNKLYFPFIAQFANRNRILCYTKESVAETCMRCIVKWSKEKNIPYEKLLKDYKSRYKDILGTKKSLFAPSKRKISSLEYQPLSSWAYSIPTKAELECICEMLTKFNNGITK